MTKFVSFTHPDFPVEDALENLAGFFYQAELMERHFFDFPPIRDESIQCKNAPLTFYDGSYFNNNTIATDTTDVLCFVFLLPDTIDNRVSFVTDYVLWLCSNERLNCTLPDTYVENPRGLAILIKDYNAVGLEKLLVGSHSLH